MPVDREYSNSFFGNSSEDDNFAPESISSFSSTSESVEMDCEEMSNLINDLKTPAEDQVGPAQYLFELIL